MTIFKHLLLQGLFLLAFTQIGLAQEDSVVVYDTVTIVKSPYVINKTVVLPPGKKISSPSRFFVAAVGGLQYYSSFSSVCEQCEEFYNTTRTTNKASIGYTGGLELLYKPGRLFITLSALYNQYREKFNFTDSSNTVYQKPNTFSYLESYLGGGLRLGKDKNIQLLLSAEARMSFLINASGLTPDTSEQRSAVALNEVHTFRKTIPGVQLSAKLLCKLYHKIYLMPELSYGYDLKSMVNNTGPFTIQRNIYSVRLCLVKGF